MRYLSILRGINVGGHKKINMHDLESLYEDLGLKNIVTYIQSGNVIFDSSTKNENTIKSKIESAIQEKYNFSVPVFIRENHEIDNIVKKCPFGTIDMKNEGTTTLVTFLSSIPEAQNIDDVLKYVLKPEKLVVSGSNVYLSCPNGYGKSKLSNGFIESKLKTEATTRNWKTVVKLSELLAL